VCPCSANRGAVDVAPRTRAAFRIAGLTRKLVCLPTASVVAAFDDDFRSLGRHGGEKSVAVDTPERCEPTINLQRDVLHRFAGDLHPSPDPKHTEAAIAVVSHDRFARSVCDLAGIIHTQIIYDSAEVLNLLDNVAPDEFDHQGIARDRRWRPVHGVLMRSTPLGGMPRHGFTAPAFDVSTTAMTATLICRTRYGNACG
jgi:hypothetical protein